MLAFEVSPLQGGAGLKLSGELDLATAPQLDAALLLEASAPGELRLDLSELTFVDSSGMGTILAHARSRNGAGPVVLVDPPERFVRALEIMGVEQHPGIEVRRSARTAIKDFG
jgi:anti-sigma B factor antagonist